MKKYLKIFGIVFGSLVLLFIVAGLVGWFYVKSTFLDFEDDYQERTSFNELTVNGYTFLDRNNNGALDIYEDDRNPIELRIEDVLSQMTTEEKIHLLKGSGMASGLGRTEPGQGIPGAVGTIVPTPRLGLPTLYLSDGPAGLRIEPMREGEDRTYYATAFPIATLLASTWNTDLVNEVGRAMGNEALEYGIDVILGPGVNIHRHPFCGRNFEYFSEDPLLTGFMGAAMVNGIEASGVGTSVKHFVANNQETNRNFNDAIVSERALREIYLKGFELVVENSQPLTIMSSYNKVNGTYVTEDYRLLTEILRDQWNFEGLVMSDWFGGQDAVAQIKAGNDLLEPGTNIQWRKLVDAQKNGNLTEQEIDTAVRRILKLIFQSKKMQGYKYSNDPDLKAHALVTRQSAAEGMVLLENRGVLPLKKSQRIALLGITSYDFIAGGTGSGDVNEAYTVSLEEGLENAGFTIDKTAKDLYENHKKAHQKEFVKPQGFNAMFKPYQPPQIPYTTAQLAQIASEADLGIVTIGRNSGEGGDRVEKDDFLLTDYEMDLINNAARVFHDANKPLVAVLNVGGVVETASWKSVPDAVLLAWQGGQESGNSVADILSGKVNPSGKLPMTFPIRVADHASHKNFPLSGKPMDFTGMIFGKKKKEDAEKIPNEDFTLYEEGIYVGYRHFDKAGLEVSYPFGYGLSYTTFAYQDLSVDMQNDTIKINVSVKNTGNFKGKESVQVYISNPGSLIDRPVQELKSFAKTKLLHPDETEVLELNIPVKNLSYWDEKKNHWELEKGVYHIKIGASSRKIPLAAMVEI